ncbi:unnamed protein product [Prunus brigantina]
MPYNPGRHWVLLIVKAKRETVYFLDPLPGNRVVDEEDKNIVNSAIKIYNSHIARPGRKAPIWKTLPGTPKQPSSVECGYYVMRFMRDTIMDPSLEFEKKVRRKFSYILCRFLYYQRGPFKITVVESIYYVGYEK